MAIELRSGGARAVILPEFGGRLHQLFVPFAGGEEPILSTPADVAAYDARPTRGGAFSMAPWPNRIRESRFRWNGREYTVPSEGKPNAIHGRVLNKPWAVTARAGSVVELVCAFDEGWPWRGKAWQRFELTERALITRLEVRSERDPFPAGCGWHPWFRRDVFGASSVRVGVKAKRRYLLVDQLPTGETVAPGGEFDLAGCPELGARRLDDCYGGIEAPVTIDWGAAQLSIAIGCEEPHLQVYTPEEAFCLEPQTCAPDAFNLHDRGIAGTGFAVATPASPVRITSRWEWTVG